ncbi:MAG: glycogen debranching enzyme GlgX [Spirochaetes bacterium]|nr:MAG: glycogen debranching enzyme GlgX [Spirochaetota bacterium]
MAGPASPARVTLPGYPLPLGVKLDRNGAQFSLFSRNATAVSLVLFAADNGMTEEIAFDPLRNRTGDIWHIWAEGIREGQLYGYRIDGPYDPERGFRFNRNKLVLDPYARSVSGNFKWDLSDARGFDTAHPVQDLSYSTVDSAPGAPKCVIVNTDFDWFDRQLGTPMKDTVIYELHVKGFTAHTSSKTDYPGTFRGLTDKIPYMKELGVTAVELMPIQEFDEEENVNVNPRTGEKLKNYWGYSTISFFAPRGRFSHSGRMGEQYQEFKEMVYEFHKAGIEVILDIVFNHTAEGDHLGPTLCFRGIDNTVYYMLQENRRFYKNLSGCGNTFNCNHPFVRDFILDCLRYWVIEMRVDGFRFDLASILGRDQEGNMQANPPLLERIAEDPILRNAKIIAEAWDAGGAYQVGDFPGRWAEWNGKYRDDVRRFWRGESGSAGSFATRLMGSRDLYFGKQSPLHSVNFITCHDGFTLNDLVSYARKHNKENGEENRDGENYNISMNFGIEGAAATPLVERLRARHAKNLLATLFLSQGVPMLLAGDEFRRTQRGNNNAYCQDNEISWVDWSGPQRHEGIARFTRLIMRFRREHPLLRRGDFFTGEAYGGLSSPDVTWHGVKAWEPDWSDDSRFTACMLNGEYARLESGRSCPDIYMAFNASLCGRFTQIPPSPSGARWRRVVDTSLPSPADILEPGTGQPLEGDRYYVQRLSVLVLVAP